MSRAQPCLQHWQRAARGSVPRACRLRWCSEWEVQAGRLCLRWHRDSALTGTEAIRWPSPWHSSRLFKPAVCFHPAAFLCVRRCLVRREVQGACVCLPARGGLHVPRSLHQPPAVSPLGPDVGFPHLAAPTPVRLAVVSTSRQAGFQCAGACGTPHSARSCHRLNLGNFQL